MAYSNGYNLQSVLTGLRGRLAWSTASQLNSANTTTASGRRFDDGSFHAAVSVSNIKSIVEDQTDWNAYFTARQEANIIRSLQSVFNKTEFFEQTFLYDACEGQEQLIANEGQAFGWKIMPVKRQDVTMQINSLQLYFDGAATFNVYLFKQGVKAPIKTKSVTTVANNKITVSLEDWFISYKDAAVYYIAAFQNDLGSVRAIRELSEEPKFLMFDAESFSSAASGTEFDRVSPSLTDQPFGINANISSFRDITANIVNQPHLFDQLQGLCMAAQTLEEIIYSTRSNATERILKEQFQTIGLQMDLNGAAAISNGPKIMGLRQRIEAEAERIRDSFYRKPKSQVVNVAH